MKHDAFIKKFQVPEAAYRSIDKLFTKEEIDFVCGMEKETFTEEDLADIDIADGKQFLKNSYRRGIISMANEDKGIYRVSDFYNRLDIFSISETETWRSLPEDDRKAMDEWYFETYYAGLDPNPEIPPTGDEILPLDEVLSFIDRQDRPVYLNYCDCRSLSGACEMPTRTCITYKNGINSFAHRGLSEPINKERAKEIVRSADRAGLVHTVQPNGICNCCSDCCYLFRGQRKRNSRGVWPKSSYVVEFDAAKCFRCGNCVKRCGFGVFSQEETSSAEGKFPKRKKVSADTSKCIGCGLCVQGCPAGALKLSERRQSNSTSPVIPD
ncbi:MAG TPA: 4Fe-4S dicluster domain-containing protein [Anaerovoracaceae bacterium]|nr:4Fe-4S dicluster domain-containing protein [Anaerovoracaceae bacterium]